MNVLSLFDGISGAKVALERASIQVSNYYSSEVDKYANIISDKNHSDIIRLGDVSCWKEWDLNWNSIDLLIAGFPCQAWSVAGKQRGFGDDRGVLGRVTFEILNHLRGANREIKFLFENVRMKKENLNMFDNLFGVNHVKINSSLLSAQRRIRCYWCNWKVEQPGDKGILLKDVLEDNVLGKYFLSARMIDSFERKPERSPNFNGRFKPLSTESEKSTTLTARYYKMGVTDPYILVGGLRDKAGLHQEESKKIRRLTPVECERLQTYPDNYTSGVSDTQRYKALGNSFTVDVISHILNQLREE